MAHKPQSKGMIEKKLESPDYLKRHEERYSAFKLEAQLLYAIERKKWSYDDLAKVMQTQKSNISRDLKAGGILKASISRISKMADALGMHLVTLLVPKDQVGYALPKIEDIVRASFNATFADARVTAKLTMPPAQAQRPDSGVEVLNMKSSFHAGAMQLCDQGWGYFSVVEESNE